MQLKRSLPHIQVPLSLPLSFFIHAANVSGLLLCLHCFRQPQWNCCGEQTVHMQWAFLSFSTSFSFSGLFCHAPCRVSLFPEGAAPPRQATSRPHSSQGCERANPSGPVMAEGGLLMPQSPPCPLSQFHVFHRTEGEGESHSHHLILKLNLGKSCGKGCPRVQGLETGSGRLSSGPQLSSQVYDVSSLHH